MLLATTSLASAGVLVWMRWRLIGRERAAEAQRLQGQLETAADRVEANLRQAVCAVSARLAAWGVTPPALDPGG